MTARLPKAAPAAQPSYSESFERRVRVKRVADRTLHDAEDRARAIMALAIESLELAQRTAQEILADAQAEAAKILAGQPDHEAMIRTRTWPVIRKVLDARGLAFAALMQPGQRKNPAVAAARAETIRAINAKLPEISDQEIGALFRVSTTTIRKWRGLA